MLRNKFLLSILLTWFVILEKFTGREDVLISFLVPLFFLFLRFVVTLLLLLILLLFGFEFTTTTGLLSLYVNDANSYGIWIFSCLKYFVGSLDFLKIWLGSLVCDDVVYVLFIGVPFEAVSGKFDKCKDDKLR